MTPRARVHHVVAGLEEERAFFAARAESSPSDAPPLIAGMDEVGRGALAGPVSVGVAVLGPDVGEVPAGLADSKLLRAPAREALVAPVRAWVRGVAVAHASPEEIDDLGIVAALRLAGTRALTELADAGLAPDLVLLDGTHDWLTPPPCTLLDGLDGLDRQVASEPDGEGAASDPAVRVPPVRTVRKGDARCASVAAASVVAKVTRDAILEGLEDPGYGFARHKGYGTATHRAAIAALGPSSHHRRTWRLT